MPEMPIDWQKEQIERRKAKAKKKKSGGNSSSSNRSSGTPLAELIEKQASAQQAKAKAKPSKPKNSSSPGVSSIAPNPVDSMMRDFMNQYNSINVERTPYEELRKMANEQVGAQFDPMIELLKKQMEAKESRGNKSMGEARGMYNALSSDFLAELPKLTEQFAAEDRETNNRYNSAQNELKKMYNDQSKEQNAILQQLGITAAAPDASRQAKTDQTYFQNQMELDQQQSVSALNEQQNAAKNYQRNLGDTTKIAGENVAQDIKGSLEEYLDQADSQMGGLKGQKSQALAALLQQMQSQDAANAQKQEQQQFDNLLALSNLQLDAAQASAKINKENAPKGEDEEKSLFRGTSGLTGAQNFLAQQYPDSPILASGLMEQLNDVLANPDVVRGKYELSPANPGLGKSATYSDVGQEYMMDLLRAEIEKENEIRPGRYSTGDINNTINALLAYMGKLR